MNAIYLGVPVMLVLAIVQAAVLPHFPILGLTPLLPLVAAVAWGLLRGLEEGAAWAFFAGVAMDLFSYSPMGANALALMAGGLAATAIYRSLPSSRFVLPLLLMALATLVYQLVYFLILRLLGYPVNLVAAVTLLPTAVLHAFLIIPVFWGLGLVERTFWPRPVEMQ